MQFFKVIYLFIYLFLKCKLIYNVVLVSAVQPSDSVMYIYTYICIYIFFFRFFSTVGYYKVLSIVPCVGYYKVLSIVPCAIQ